MRAGDWSAQPRERADSRLEVDLGRVGVWSRELRLGPPLEVQRAAAEVEDLGFGAIWIPGVRTGVFERAEELLVATTRLVVAAGIVSIWVEPPERVRAGYRRLSERYPERFLLGLGVSHGETVNRGHTGRYGQPLRAMGDYLDELDVSSETVPVEGRVLAALGPRMLELAHERAGGAHPFLVTPEHTKSARQILGDGLLLAPEQGVIIEPDPGAARSKARRHLEAYFGFANYRQNLSRLGFGDEDFEGGGSERLIDSLVAWGDVESVARRVREHAEAGADHVAIQVIGDEPGQLPLASWRQMSTQLQR